MNQPISRRELRRKRLEADEAQRQAAAREADASETVGPGSAVPESATPQAATREAATPESVTSQHAESSVLPASDADGSNPRRASADAAAEKTPASRERASDGRPRERGASANGRRDDSEERTHGPARRWLDRIVMVAVIWAIWAFITTFVVQPFRIPSSSMENTLQIGDRIVVAKWAPRFSDIKRGDVIVFKDPGGWTDPVPSSNAVLGAIRKVAEVTHLSASGSHLVKRVVGVGGDTVACDGPGAKLKVNGVAINETYLKTGVTPCQDKFSITVPAEKVWVMGDNRSNSADSRYHDDGTGKLGSVPISDITGRGLAVVWPIGQISGGHNDEDAFSKVPAAK